MLDKDSHKPFKASEWRPVNHDGLVGGVVSADVFQSEALGKVVIQLYCA